MKKFIRNQIYKVVCTLRRHALTASMWEFFDDIKATMDIALVSDQEIKQFEEHMATFK